MYQLPAGPPKAWIAALRGCHFYNLVAFRGLSRIDHLWNGHRLHFETGKGTRRNVMALDG